LLELSVEVVVEESLDELESLPVEDEPESPLPSVLATALRPPLP
jgi:hypothetical protein